MSQLPYTPVDPNWRNHPYYVAPTPTIELTPDELRAAAAASHADKYRDTTAGEKASSVFLSLVVGIPSALVVTGASLVAAGPHIAGGVGILSSAIVLLRATVALFTAEKL